LMARSQPMVAILWGRDAGTLKPMLSDHCVAIESPHPSPLSAHRGFLGCGHFSAANHYLTCNGQPGIDWQLPRADVLNQLAAVPISS